MARGEAVAQHMYFSVGEEGVDFYPGEKPRGGFPQVGCFSLAEGGGMSPAPIL
jgi:hypothetical protein